MRSGKRLLSAGLLAACLAAVPAASQARTPVDDHAARHHHAAASAQLDATSASCDADVFLYNYRPRKTKS